MSTLQQRIVALAQGIGADVKALNGLIGVLSGLNTSAKSNLVAALNELQGIASSNASAIGTLGGLTTTSKTTLVGAINEVKEAVSAVDLTALINDAATAGTTNKTYSADKIIGLLSSLETKIMGGISPEALDTVKELADFLSDETVANGIVAQMSKRVRVDAPQTFAAEEQAQARANIGAASAQALQALTDNIGNTDHDFVADYNTAKA
jgi:hypothetical protein